MAKKVKKTAPAVPDESASSSETAAPAAPAGRLWIWFGSGCLLAFVCTLFAPMYTYNGLGVERVTMAEYYLIEFGRLGELGPASNSGALTTNIVEHLFITLAGGAAFLAIGWAVARFFGKPPTS